MTSIVTLQKVDLCVVALLVHIEELHTAVTTTHLSTLNPPHEFPPDKLLLSIEPIPKDPTVTKEPPILLNPQVFDFENPKEAREYALPIGSALYKRAKARGVDPKIVVSFLQEVLELGAGDEMIGRDNSMERDIVMHKRKEEFHSEVREIIPWGEIEAEFFKSLIQPLASRIELRER